MSYVSKEVVLQGGVECLCVTNHDFFTQRAY